MVVDATVDGGRPGDYVEASECARFERECTCEHTLKAHGTQGCKPMYCACSAPWTWVGDDGGGV